MTGASSRPRTRFVRAASFSAAHRYYDPSLSDDENKKIYGSLYRQDGFGHNFNLEVHLEGDVDDQTGMIVNLSEVDAWLKSVMKELDHKDLNQITAFRKTSPTPERMAQYIFAELQKHLDRHLVDLSTTGVNRQVRLIKVRLHEGDHLWIDCISTA